MACLLLPDPSFTEFALVKDLSEWLTHCHSGDVVLELQRLKRTLTATNMIEALTRYKWLAGILVKRFPNAELPFMALKRA